MELCGCVDNADVGISSDSCCRCRSSPAPGSACTGAEIPAEELALGHLCLHWGAAPVEDRNGLGAETLEFSAAAAGQGLPSGNRKARGK